jgi:hypothetical protein
MSSVDYIALRQSDWYSEAREDHADTRFCCVAQKGIYEDIYHLMSQRVCYMHVLYRTLLPVVGARKVLWRLVDVEADVLVRGD